MGVTRSETAGEDFDSSRQDLVSDLADLLRVAEEENRELPDEVHRLIAQVKEKLAPCLDPASVGDVEERERQATEKAIGAFLGSIYNKGSRKKSSQAIRRLQRWCGSRHLQAPWLSSQEIQTFLDDEARHTSERKLRQLRDQLRSLYHTLIAHEFRNDNPVPQESTPCSYRESLARALLLSSDDVRSIFASFVDRKAVNFRRTAVTNLRDRAMIGLIFYTFTPMASLRMLRVGDYVVKGEKQFICVGSQEGATCIPLHPQVATYIEEYLQSVDFGGSRDAFLFPASDGYGVLTSRQLYKERDTMRGILRFVGKRIGVTELTARRLRLAGVTALRHSNWAESEEGKQLLGYYKEGGSANYPFLVDDTSNLGELFDVPVDITAPLREVRSRLGMHRSGEGNRENLEGLVALLRVSRKRSAEIPQGVCQMMGVLKAELTRCFMSPFDGDSGKGEDEGVEEVVSTFRQSIFSEATRLSYGRTIRFLQGWCRARHLQIHRLSSEQILTFLDDCWYGYSERMLQIQRDQLRSLYHIFIAHGFRRDNPVPLEGTSTAYPAGLGRTLLLSSDDVRSIFASFVDRKAVNFRRTAVTNLRDRAMIGLIFYAFIPPHSLRRLRVGDYDLNGDKKIIRVDSDGKEALIPLHPQAVTLLEEYLQAVDFAGNPNALLFPASDAYGSLVGQKMAGTQFVFKALRPVMKQTGLTGLTVKRLRLAGVTALRHSNWAESEEGKQLLGYYKEGGSANYPFLVDDTSNLGELFDVPVDIAAPLRDVREKLGISRLLENEGE